MESFHVYQPETLERMTLALERAAKELELDGLPLSEKERLATCILSIGNCYTDVNRLHERAVRLYLRGRSVTFEPRHRAPLIAVAQCLG